MDFLRELLKTNEGFMPDFNSMTDFQLMDLCRELDMEDMCELDDDGRIVNREELIRDLESGRGVDADIDVPREPADVEHDEPYEPDFDTDVDTDYTRPIDAGDDVPEGGEYDDLRYPTEAYTNLRQSFNFYKPVKMKKGFIKKNIKLRRVKAQTIKEDSMSTVKFKNPYTKIVSPSHGGLQKDVTNKSAKQAIEDEIGNAGMKGMKKKDRPYMEKPRFRDWLTGNMVFNMTKSGELAGKMKLGEGQKWRGENKCWDCGSTIPGHHTPLCDLTDKNDKKDLPQKPGTQHWTGKVPQHLKHLSENYSTPFPIKDALEVGFPDVKPGDTIRTRKSDTIGTVEKIVPNHATNNWIADAVFFRTDDGKRMVTPLYNVTIVRAQ